MKNGLVSEHLHHLQITLRKHVEAYSFIRKHKVWKGFWEYGWVSKIMMVLAILAGLKFLQIYFQWLSEAYDSDPITAISSMGGMMWEAVSEEYNFFFAGGMKYMIVIFMEIVIYHASRKTVKMLTGQDEEATFKNFVKAQVRMIKVSFQSYIMEIIFTALIGMAFSFSIFSFIGFMKPVLIFAVQCFFLGFAVMDNYSEQFNMSIKESLKLSKEVFGNCDWYRPGIAAVFCHTGCRTAVRPLPFGRSGVFGHVFPYRSAFTTRSCDRGGPNR
jgi:CysZ protein